jgi:short-subunit dehydrogenase
LPREKADKTMSDKMATQKINKKVIIIGATSGIGRALAKALSERGCILGITGRRLDLLQSLQAELKTQSYVANFDVSNSEDCQKHFQTLLQQLGGADIVIINSGLGSINPEFPLQEELQTVAVNVAGFTTIANLAYHYFSARESGHIVGVSSVAAVRGGPIASYNASKAYVSSFLEGLACRAHGQQINLCITDVRPGFVDTAMAQGDGQFWVAPVDLAAKQIIKGLERQKRVIYVTRRWRLIAGLISLLPFSMYKKLVS